MPPSIQEILSAVQPFLLPPSLRPSFVKASVEQEIESKIHIDSSRDVVEVLEILQSVGITCTESRSETHHLFSLEDGAHVGRILVAGQKAEWIKVKSRNTPIFTPHHHFPAVFREAVKLTPGDETYDSFYAITLGTPYVIFNKECVNFFYSYKECVFSLSLSLAWNDSGFIRQEMEFEYEGTQDAVRHPVQVDAIFEDMLIELIPAHLRRKLHAKTKYESLQVS